MKKKSFDINVECTEKEIDEIFDFLEKKQIRAEAGEVKSEISYDVLFEMSVIILASDKTQLKAKINRLQDSLQKEYGMLPMDKPKIMDVDV